MVEMLDFAMFCDDKDEVVLDKYATEEDVTIGDIDDSDNEEAGERDDGLDIADIPSVDGNMGDEDEPVWDALWKDVDDDPVDSLEVCRLRNDKETTEGFCILLD